MANLLKLLGVWAFAAALIFFNAWCLNLIYVSAIPLFTKFAVILPELTYGVFVLIELILSFFILYFRNIDVSSKIDVAPWYAKIITHELILLILAACAVWASSIVFS